MTLREQFEKTMAEIGIEDRTKVILDRLSDVQRELDHESKKHGMSPTGKELWDYDAAVIEQAGKLLHALAMEQYRQREAAKLYLAGRIDRDDLRRISSNWNGGDKAAPHKVSEFIAKMMKEYHLTFYDLLRADDSLQMLRGFDHDDHCI